MAIELTVMSLDFDSDEPPRKEVFNKSEVIFGRSEDSDVVLNGEEVSTLHAKLYFDNNKLMIADLGSINGTLVDNIPLEANKPLEITENQRILISGYLIKPKLVEGNIEIEEEKEDLDEVNEDILYNDVFEEAPIEAKEVVEIEEDIFMPAVSEEPEVSKVIEEDLVKANDELVGSANLQTAVVSSPTINSSNFATTETIVDGEDLIQIDFEALKLCSLSGKVNNKGLAVSGVNIFINSELKAKTDASGTFTISEVEEDSNLTITFEKNGYIFDPKELNLIIENNKQISIEAKKLITVKGRVANKGNPVANVKVIANGIGETTTDENGVYAFHNVIEGTKIAIQVSKEGFKFISKK